MSGMVNTIVKNHFEVDLNFYPIRVIPFRNSDPSTSYKMSDQYGMEHSLYTGRKLLRQILPDYFGSARFLTILAYVA